MAERIAPLSPDQAVVIPTTSTGIVEGIGGGNGEGIASVQRRTLRLLFATQVLGGIGMAIGFSVGTLLAADMAGVGLSGLAPSAAVVGSALLAVPATRVVERYGRRPSMASAYLIAALGSAVVVVAAAVGSMPALLGGFFLFGGGTTAGFQARYAAVDLAPAALRARHLSLVVWATTLGVVTGPNLAPLAGIALGGYGVPTLAAPFLFSAALLAAAAITLLVGMRPDPIVVARTARDERDQPAERGPSSEPDPPAAPNGKTTNRQAGMSAAMRAIASNPSARLGIAAAAIGHLVMVGVMAMTPVHVLGAGHDAAHTLRIVGILLSLHVAGMYAFAPVTGWLTDRYGRRSIILGGAALLLLACAVAGTAGQDPKLLSIGLTLLGLGWSGTMIAGSTLLSESVPNGLRTSAQGLSDLTMGLAGAFAAVLAGPILQSSGFPALTLTAALAATPLVALALGHARERSRSPQPAEGNDGPASVAYDVSGHRASSE